MPQLRKPTQQEKEALFDYLSTFIWYDIDDPVNEAHDAVENAAIAVFDDYASDTGYTGKIMTVIWRGGPELYQVYRWREGEITPVTQNPLFQV